MADLAAVFLDRDGVINAEHGYVHRWEDFSFLPGAIEGMKRLTGAGYALVIVTNQAGIARGYYDEAAYAALTGKMLGVLAEQGINVLGVYHCPHHPDAAVEALREDCNCRKPAPGMLLAAASDHGLDLARCVLVGDKRSDIDAGRAAGLGLCVQVRSGHAVDAADAAAADACLADLDEASQWLLARAAVGGQGWAQGASIHPSVSRIS